MLIIQRLYLTDFVKALFLIAPGLSIIFSLLDLINKIDEFPTAGKFFLYAFYIMPKYILYLLPMSVLICSLFIFGQAAGRKEITAIKAAGGRLRDLFYPFIITGIFLSIAAFIISETIVPAFSKKAVELKSEIEGKKRRFATNEGGLWLKSGDGSPVKIDLFVVGQNIAKGVNIFVFGKDFLKEKIVADKALWNGNTWILENITKYDVDTGEIVKLKTMNYPELESPDLFTEQIKLPEEMGISELYRYNQRLKNAGFRNSRLVVDLHSKISFPVINMVMILLGISLSLRGKLGGGLFSAGLGLLLSMLYWLSYTFLLSLGYAGIVPPFFSAWITPFLFGAFSFYMLTRLPE